MPREKFTLAQNLIGGTFSTVKISTEYVDDNQLDAKSLSVFSHDRPLGISPGYSELGRLVVLAISDDQNCRVIRFKPAKAKKPRLPTVLESVLCRPSGDILAFDMSPLAMSLYFDFHLRITNAVDIQSGIPSLRRDPFVCLIKTVGKDVWVDRAEVDDTFRDLIYRPDEHLRVPTRAWVSQFLATYDGGLFSKVPRIDSNTLNEEQLQMLSKLSMDALRLDIKKPTQVMHPANIRTDPSTNGPQLESIGYSIRVRPNKDVIVTANGQFGTFNVHGSIGQADGRINDMKTARLLEDATDVTVTTVGREDATSIEAHRASIIRRILQGAHHLLDNPWIRNIWFPRSDELMSELMSWPDNWAMPPLVPKFTSIPSMLPLNQSQQIAVNTMLSHSSDHCITLVQGPPGTGKTSVIATFVQLSTASGRAGIWIIAQSNVAVKNIAEKLIKVHFTKWRLLVSKEFHFDWHEHLYTEFKGHIIRSDDFDHAEPQFDGIPVILCTVSMLSNKKVKSSFMHKVPVNCLVVDEASQIEIGNFIPAFIHCASTLRKVAFIGDHNQLPPHGQEDIKDLQSVFEFPHLNNPEKLCFLNIQYRMPPAIGTFISQNVYQGQLNSDDHHPVKTLSACKFIDAGGNECKSNQSYQNQAECSAIIKLATKLQNHNKSYHIITPYTSQRDFIEARMRKTSGLHWEDKCFTVDSFQGNEDDYIIISVVRSTNIGFMKNLRRTNVMLTRCKRGMFIVSSELFCKGPGSQSLVGKMAKGKSWIAAKDLERRVTFP